MQALSRPIWPFSRRPNPSPAAGAAIHSTALPTVDYRGPPCFFPPEIVLAILQLAIDSLSDSSRATFLQSTSLVSRAWRDASQWTLHSSVVLHSETVVSLWLPSLARWRPVSLELRGDLLRRRDPPGSCQGMHPIRANQALALVSMCGADLRHLTLCGFSSLPISILSDSNLTKLESLTFKTDFTFPNGVDPDAPPPYNPPTPSPYLRTLSTLTISHHLMPHADHTRDPHPFPAFFSLLAPHLTSLTLPSSPPSALLLRLPLCTKLSTLSYRQASGNLAGVLQHLPRGVLKVLRVRISYTSEVLRTLQLILRELEGGGEQEEERSLSKVEVIELEMDRAWGSGEYVEGVLERVCRERGVKLVARS